jgi:hypothetical protein
MTNARGHALIPDLAERTALNAALVDDDAETGFWDDHGRPAPWPDDIEDWAPTASSRRTAASAVSPNSMPPPSGR